MKKRIKIVLINAGMIIFLALLVFTATTWWRLHTQFRLAEDAFAKGNFIAAVAGYEAAIHMYLPFSATVEASAGKLWQLGEITEQQGNLDRALIAYRALRSSFYSTRWLTTPGLDWIERCDQKIAALTPLQRER